MKKLIYIFILIISSPSFSQNPEIDSLLLVLKIAKEDTNKINLLNKLAKKTAYSGDLKKGNFFADKALALSQSLNYEKGIAISYQMFGVVNSEKGNYNAAIDYYNQALPLLQKLKVKRELASLYGDLGNALYMKGLLTKSLECFLKSLKIYENLDDKQAIAGFSGNIGLIYESINNNDKALEFYNKALQMNRAIDYQQGIAISYISIGMINSKLKKEKTALVFFKKALEIDLVLNDPYYLAVSLLNISSSYNILNDKPNALLYANKVIEHCSMGDDIAMTIRANRNLAKIYTKYGNYRLAEKILLDNQPLLLKINSISQKRESNNALSDLYYKMGNYKKAMDYYTLSISLKDSMLNDESNRKIMEQQAQYEYEKKSTADSIKIVAERKVVDLQFKQEKTQRYALFGGLLLIGLFSIFIFSRFRTISKQKKIIELKENETQLQKHVIEEKQKEILDSINYAKRIQYSLLASDKLLNENLPEHFLFFKPKDVVSGDFYWGSKLINNNFLLVTADSTGHGVPGAIMSMLNISCLNESIKENNIQPADILNATRKKIIDHLSNDGSADGGKDGMDCSLVSFDFKNKKLTYAAANNPVWIVRKRHCEGVSLKQSQTMHEIASLPRNDGNYELIALPADRMPVGKHDRDSVLFTQREVELQSGDMVYTLTDGFPDQFGGSKGKKFKYKQLEELLISIAHESMENQKQTLDDVFETWKGNLEQVDDVCIIGVRV